MRSPRTKLNKKAIDGTPLPPEGPVRLHDSGARGLHLRSAPTGVRTWYVTYRTAERGQRDYKIGRYPDLGPEAARIRAVAVLAEVANGKDPASEKRVASKQTTIAELCERFLSDHAQKKLKPATQQSYKDAIRLHIKPALGTIRIAALATSDVENLHIAMSETPRAANFAVATLSSMMSRAIAWGMRPDGQNPAQRIKHYKENKRKRYLSQSEFRRLWTALNAEEAAGTSGDVPLAVRLLLLTGRRKGEIQAMKWGNVDLDGARLHLRDSKVGERVFDLSEDVVSLLRSVRRKRGDDATDDAFVVRAMDGLKPLTNIQKPWRRIRKAAQIPDVRLHDLRHTYASFAAAAGYDLMHIKEMLGHQTIQTTQRYAHLTNEAVRTGINTLGQKLFELANSSDSADFQTTRPTPQG